MLDLIRQSAVPAGVVRSAAKGALTLPAGEMLEILVFLTSNPIFAEDAKMTLAGWDLDSATSVASDAATPWEVLEYLVAPENLRPKLLPALLENPSIREARLVDMAQSASRETLDMMLASPRVQKSEHVLHALLTNANLTEIETQKIKESLTFFGSDIEAYTQVHTQEKTQYEIDHADEIAAEEALNKPFELIAGIVEEEESAATPAQESPQVTQPPDASQPSIAAAAAAPASQPQSEPQASVAVPAAASAEIPAETIQKMRAAEAASRERISALQKIARLGVSQRIQLAMKGTKEERFILVRDGSKLVSQAVLQSPKLSDPEVEMFASMKNVQEGVLREIARSHKFIKNYGVIRNLVSNPRCPLDLSLSLMNHLMVNDLKSLSTNKNIADTLRKLALKRFKEKTEKKH
jgi:hypothetical protein